MVDLHDDDPILEADDDRNHPKDGGEDARQLVLARLLVRSGERVDAELEVDAAKGVERTGPDVAKDDSGRAEAEGEELPPRRRRAVLPCRGADENQATPSVAIRSPSPGPLAMMS